MCYVVPVCYLEIAAKRALPNVLPYMFPLIWKGGGGEGGEWRRSELSMQVILDSLYPGGQSI